MNAEQKKKAGVICFKLRKGLLQTIAVLESDVEFAVARWEQERASQFWRRTLLRCCCASVEGTLSLLKNVTDGSADFFGVNLSEGDLKVVNERRTYRENGVTKTKPAFLPFRDNIKETFKVFAKAHSVQTAIKCDAPGFSDLCDTFELRNKLMHPKGVFDLEVSDKAIDAADRGLKWFGSTVENVMELCGKQVSSSKEQT